VDKGWLERRLNEGASFEAIGRELGTDSSTVAYWARKHGLASSFAERHAGRGGLEREILEPLVVDGLTLREIAAAVERSPSTVRHWLKQYGLATRRERAKILDGQPGDDEQLRLCRRHGETAHRRRAGSGYRCLRCRSEAVADRRRRVKAILVAEAGGACARCGYTRSVAALHFHHVDPKTKAFSLSFAGVTRSIAAAREEAAKCVLLCANCHAEVETAGAIIDPRSVDPA
jgi:transposase-like protein